MFLLISGILIMAILFAVVRDISAGDLQGAAVVKSQASLTEFTAEVIESDAAVTPRDRLVAMREQISQYRESRSNNTERFIVVDEPVHAAADSDSEVLTTAANGVQRCAGYQQFGQVWPPTVQIDEREGARLVYTESDEELDESAPSAPMLSQTILLQLPVYPRPAPSPLCINSDVIGIANDGSLIRNSEAGVYGVFGSASIVGYALDGYPIYGTDNSVRVDSCGGAVGAAGYGYVIQSDRSEIINCFTATPVSL